MADHRCPNCGISLRGTGPRAVGGATEAILALVRVRGSITAADAAAATSASRKAAYNALAYLTRHGVTERVGYGRYRLVAQQGGQQP